MTPVRPSGLPAQIDTGAPAVLEPSDVVIVGVVDGEEHGAEGGRSAIFDAAQTVRGFGRAFSELPAGFSDKVEVARRWHWRPAPAVWSALQHAAHFADLLAGIAADLSYLLDGGRRARFDLPAGADSVSNDLEADVVLAVLAGNAERVARLLEAAPTKPGEGAGFPIAVGGVIVTLARQAVRDGVSALAAAHDALTRAAAAPRPPPNADGAAIGYVDVALTLPQPRRLRFPLHQRSRTPIAVCQTLTATGSVQPGVRQLTAHYNSWRLEDRHAHFPGPDASARVRGVMALAGVAGLVGRGLSVLVAAPAAGLAPCGAAGGQDTSVGSAPGYVHCDEYQGGVPHSIRRPSAASRPPWAPTPTRGLTCMEV